MIGIGLLYLLMYLLGEEIKEFSREKLEEIGHTIIACNDFQHDDFPAFKVFDRVFSPRIVDMEIDNTGQMAILLIRANTNYGNNTQSALYKLKITDGVVEGRISKGIQEYCPKQRTQIIRENNLCIIRCYDEYERKMVERVFYE